MKAESNAAGKGSKNKTVGESRESKRTMLFCPTSMLQVSLF